MTSAKFGLTATPFSIQWSLMDSFLHWHFNLASFGILSIFEFLLFKNSRIINNFRLLNSKFKASCASHKNSFCLSKIVEVKKWRKKSLVFTYSSFGHTIYLGNRMLWGKETWLEIRKWAVVSAFLKGCAKLSKFLNFSKLLFFLLFLKS